jgi:hypothetical protein
VKKLISAGIAVLALSLGTAGAFAASTSIEQASSPGPGGETAQANHEGEQGAVNQGGEQGAVNQGGDQGGANQVGDQGPKGEDGQSGEHGDSNK